MTVAVPADVAFLHPVSDERLVARMRCICSAKKAASVPSADSAITVPVMPNRLVGNDFRNVLQAVPLLAFGASAPPVPKPDCRKKRCRN